MDMKKMFAVSTVALCATVGFGEIASANIVGYAEQSANSKAHPTLGNSFVSVSGDMSFKLGDIKASGMVYTEDIIQFIDPSTSVIDPTKVFTYYGVNDGAVVGEDDGWYTYDPTGVIEERCANNDVFPAGTAFLATFNPDHNPTLTYSGQVITSDVEIDTKVEDVYVAHMYIANPYPANITLGNVSLQGSVYTEDIIQFINPATSVIDPARVYTYYGENDGAVVGEDDGWYTYDPTGVVEERYANSDTFEAGDAFLCTFNPAHKIKVTFTSPVE